MNNLNMRNTNSMNIFTNSSLKFIRAFINNIFNSHNPKVIKFITRFKAQSKSLAGT